MSLVLLFVLRLLAGGSGSGSGSAACASFDNSESTGSSQAAVTEAAAAEAEAEAKASRGVHLGLDLLLCFNLDTMDTYTFGALEADSLRTVSGHHHHLQRSLGCHYVLSSEIQRVRPCDAPRARYILQDIGIC